MKFDYLGGKARKWPKLWALCNTKPQKPAKSLGKSLFPINKLARIAHGSQVRTDSNHKPEREGIDMAKAAVKAKAKAKKKPMAKKSAAKKRSAKRR